MSQSLSGAVPGTLSRSNKPPDPPQPALTADSKHNFPSFDSLRAFLDHYAKIRGFEVRWETKGSAHSAADGGKAVCWCSRPKPDHTHPPQPQQPQPLDTAVANEGASGVGKKRRRRPVTCHAEQVVCGCRWFVNFNRRGEGEHADYSITTRNLTHNGHQYSAHDERSLAPQLPPIDQANILRQQLNAVVDSGVRSVLSSNKQYESVLADEQIMRRAVQLDTKRDGRLVCYAAKQCAAAINRHHQQQQQHESEQKDSKAMTDDTTPSLAAVTAEELAEAMAVAIRTQVALDEQLTAAVDVSSADGFVNIALHTTTTPSTNPSTTSHPSSIVSFPTFPLPASSPSSSSATSLPPSYLFPSIGTFHSIYNEKYGTPRQGSVTPHSRGRLLLHPHVDSQSLDGLSAYSHVWLLFVFHLNTNTAIRAKVRPPRLGAKVGVFATRSPHRPSPIGMTVARVERVELDKRMVHVSGVDLVDGTPVVDIKPYHPADCVPNATAPQWVSDGTGEGGGGLEVRVQPHVEDDMRRWASAGKLALFDDGDEALAAVVECISGDPRTLNAKRKHQHTYGTANKPPEAAPREEKDDRARRQKADEAEAEAEEVDGQEAAAVVAGGEDAGSVIYGVSVDRVDVAFRMLYQAEPVEQVTVEQAGTDREAEEAEDGGGGKRRRREVADVFHCELYEAGQTRPKLRTREWYARMRQLLTQQQQHNASNSPT